MAGSAATNGASRWLDACTLLGPRPARPAVSATPTAASAMPARFRTLAARVADRHPSEPEALLFSGPPTRVTGGCRLPSGRARGLRRRSSPRLAGCLFSFIGPSGPAVAPNHSVGPGPAPSRSHD